MATVTHASPLPGIVLEDVPWADYEAQLRIIGPRRIRVNYDSGRMELESPRWRHGHDGHLLGRMVDVLADEFEIQVEGADPVTLQRPDLEKGVEPGRLFYLGAHAARVQSVRDLDLTIDPPPDLVIEVDLTASSVARLPIFAALGIAEVWRVDDEHLDFLGLDADGTYQPLAQSRAFPSLLVTEARRFLREGRDANKTTWIKTFRTYVREGLVPQGPADA